MKNLLSLLAVSTLVLCDSVCGMRLREKYTGTKDSIREKYNINEVYGFIDGGYTPETNIDKCIDFYERFKENIFSLFLYKKDVLEIEGFYSVTHFNRGDADVIYTTYCYPKSSITEEQKSGLFSEFYEQYVLFFKWNNGYTKKEAQEHAFLHWFSPNGMRYKQNYGSEVEAWRQFNMSFDNFRTNWFSPYLKYDPSLP